MTWIKSLPLSFPGCSALLLLVIFMVILSPAGCQTSSSASTCSASTDCDLCVKNPKCLWCQTNSSCTDYPVRSILPPSSVCPLSEARWGVCWVNFEALIIAMAVVGGTLLLSITVCCCYCCCCCRGRSQARPDRDEERFARRREEIRQRSDERKAERKTKHDEIRKKYGLIPDTDHPYSKFENE